MTVAEGAERLNLCAKNGELQWGRNLTVAEGMQGPRCRPRTPFASMGPQLDSCGRIDAADNVLGCAVASMGPQLDSCGRIELNPDRVGAIRRLQWGRNLTVAEGLKAASRLPADVLLQWGRNLTVAEGRGKAAGAQGQAKLQWGRNLTVAEGYEPLPTIVLTQLLQWGRNLTVAEGADSLHAGDALDLASMGPQLDSCGRARRPAAAPAPPTRFNGAAT